ncbi:MAG TPA: vWA domain-containing protein, partial [Gemmataceae bacterium]|nr:vWA domain-containing protein [Gemmataceae bacterium]
MGNESNTVSETQFVLRRLEEALRIFGKQVEARWFWAFVLGLILLVGFAYVIAMYRRDSRSVGIAWATLLGFMRCTVYLILGAVFLLPAWQTWEKTETHSKVIIAVDVSDSMRSRDDVPTESMPVEKLPTRLDKIQEFLLAGQGTFIKELQAKNPVYLYRFGSRVDEQFKLLDKDKPWTAEEWSAWLHPNPKLPMPEGLSDADKAAFLKHQDLMLQLTNGTNLGDSLLEIVNREANNKVQGLVVISDGRSTQYSAQAFTDLRTRARLADMRLLTVAVGDYRRPISIRVAGLQAPGQARPDDRFPVRIEVEGDGLANKEMIVYLDVTSPSGAKQTLDKAFTFSAGSGGPPHAQVEFDIDAAKLGATPAGAAKPELEEGAWSLIARIPKDKREIFFEKEHQSGKQIVQVVKKPLRVLLFAGAASRDYQFVRNLLNREADQRKAEVSICLQGLREGVVQDVSADRLLKAFPSRMSEEPGREGSTDRYANLAEYDLVIAFDPDWSLLQSDQLAALEKWVNMQAGGLILVAGPVNTFNLARPANRDKLKPFLDLLPVVLQDSRLQSLSNERSSTDPWRLHFPGATADMEFLNLDEEIKEALPGWEEYFTGKSRADVKPADPVMRGFYSYYPVENVKPSATVIATFADPRAKLRGSDKEQPYLVSMPYGSGKVVYIGSG